MIQFDLPCSTFGRKSQVKLPGFESVPSGLAAATTEPGNYGFWILVSIAGQAELAAWTESDDKEPGSREMWGYSVRVFFLECSQWKDSSLVLEDFHGFNFSQFLDLVSNQINQIQPWQPGNFGDPMNLNQYTTEMRQREK